ncbi:MAG: SBBP repeat-containing protein, partial [Anaerolineae bacterium]
PLAFVPHQGQSDTAVQYEVRGQGSTLTFAPQTITFQMPDQTLQLNFIGSNQAPTIAAGQALPGIINDFNGRDAAQWVTDLPTYAGLSYQQLYPGVDLHYEGTDGLLKSTFTVATGANPANIRWQYSGAAALAVDNATGDLLVTLPDQSQLVEKAPVAWQMIDGRRVPVTVAFTLAADNSVGFALGSYDTAVPLTIDPTIVYETTLNLGYFDNGLDITTDSAGNSYVLARVYDSNNDVLIAKLSANGTLLFSTYLRGSSGDFGGGIALDASGDIYVAGGTDSADFPILNALQPTKNGVTRDAFITKLSGSDGSLLFSTFYGGSRSDIINDITLNDAGQIYLVGYTESTDFPTVNPIQNGLNLNQCFCEDTFVSQLAPDALSVLYSTYLGGSFEDYGQSIALDGSDNIYITGRTAKLANALLLKVSTRSKNKIKAQELFEEIISD